MNFPLPSLQREFLTRNRHHIIFGIIFSFGFLSRLYLISNQIIIGDEWHSFSAIAGKTYLDILKQFNPHDNSSPILNLYLLFLANNAGLSELTIRLPTVISGLLLIFYIPLLIKNITNNRVYVLFSYLLVISPSLIFYSRFFRAYSIIVFLGMLSILLFYYWLTTGRNVYIAGFFISDLIIVYAHPGSLPIVFSPFISLLIIFTRCFKKEIFSKISIKVTFQQLIIVGIFLSICTAVLLIPMISSFSELRLSSSGLTVNSFIGASTLLSGTENVFINAIFYTLFISGAVIIFNELPLLAWILATIFLLNVITLLILRPNGIGDMHVLLRYNIIVVPIALLLVSLAIEKLMVHFSYSTIINRITTTSIVILFLAALFALGPIPVFFNGKINNYAFHQLFYGPYKTFYWDKTNTFEKSPLYYSIKNNSKINTIIEYPFDICNLHLGMYFFQHIHEKKVIAGYVNMQLFQSYQNVEARVRSLCIDDILFGLKDKPPLKLHNNINLSDQTAINNSGADVIILHKYLMTERIDQGGEAIPLFYESVDYLSLYFWKKYGPPLYEDKEIICFPLKSSLKDRVAQQ